MGHDESSGWDTNWHRIVTCAGTNKRGVRISLLITALAGVFLGLAVVMGVLMGVWSPCNSGDLEPGDTMTCAPHGDTVVVRTDSTKCVSYAGSSSSWGPRIEYEGSCEVYLGFDDSVTTRNRGYSTAHVVQKTKITSMAVFPPFIVFTLLGLVLTVGTFVSCCAHTVDPHAAPPPKATYALKESQDMADAPGAAPPGFAETPGAQPVYTGYTPETMAGTQAITTY